MGRASPSTISGTESRAEIKDSLDVTSLVAKLILEPSLLTPRLETALYFQPHVLKSHVITTVCNYKKSLKTLKMKRQFLNSLSLFVLKEAVA